MAVALAWEFFIGHHSCVSSTELQKVFNLPPCKISSCQISLKIMLVMSFKIGFLFLVPADLALTCWLKVETFLNDLTYGKPSSRVVPAYPHLFCNSDHRHLRPNRKRRISNPILRKVVINLIVSF